MADNTCGSYPAIQPFVFNTVGFQNGANTTYVGFSTTAGLNGSPQFKSDYDRMKYLLGKRAVDLACCTKGTNCSGTS